MPRPKGATPKKSPSSVSFLAAMLVGALLTMGIILFLYLWNPFNQGKVVEEQTAMIQPKVQDTPPKTEYEFYDLLREQQVSGVPDEALASQTSDTQNAEPDVVVANPAPKQKPAKDSEAVTTVKNPMLADEPALSDTPTAAIKPSDVVVTEANTDANPNDRIMIANAEPTKTYILQINSFDNVNDADKRRAEVLMAGVDAQIVKKPLKDGRVLYQVISRVMNSPQQAAEDQQRLQTSGIDSIIVEQRH